MRIAKFAAFILLFAGTMCAQADPPRAIIDKRPVTSDTTAAPAPQKPQITNQFPATLSGHVLRVVGGAPLPRTRLLLVSSGIDGDQAYQSTATTDADGYYEFTDLPPNSYSLLLERPGWIEQGSDARRPQSARSINLHPGQKLTRIDFHLIQPSVLTGRVLNEYGEPIPRASVVAYRQRFTLKGRSLEPIRFESTNDLGEYRIFDLPPGSYYVALAVRDPFAEIAQRSRAKQLVYPPVFYPNTRDEGDAIPLRLVPGEENRADFNLFAVPAVHVRGTVHGLSSQARRGGANIILTTSGQVQIPEQTPRATTDERGNFDIAGVTAGNYTLVAIGFNPQESAPVIGRVAVHVGESDVDNADVTIGPNRYEIEGTMTIAADTVTRPDGLMVSLTTMSRDTTDEQFAGDTGSPVRKDGRFAIQAGAGEYALNINASRTGYEDFYLKSIRFANQDITETGILRLTSAGGKLDLLMDSHGGRIGGYVQDGDKKPVANVEVALIPEPRYRKRLDLYLTKTTDQDGNFDMRGLMPASYLVLPLPAGTEEGAYYDPDFIAQHEQEGVTVLVEENRSVPLTITMPR